MNGMYFGIMFMFLMALIPLNNAECCGVPGFCRGNGPCNIFCCNCDGGCRGKRAVSSDSSILMKFNAIDKDMDKNINVEEYQTFLLSIGYNSADKTNENQWFQSMDLNKNGVIEPQEFDKSL